MSLNFDFEESFIQPSIQGHSRASAETNFMVSLKDYDDLNGDADADFKPDPIERKLQADGLR